ncbi:MAG: WD40 repeat domain-containing protein [Gemmatimonadaceae bacterium]|nr:WD40 repeat domain-containing protein [Gloeobacterales cyanobacterium ES-bin-141]
MSVLGQLIYTSFTQTGFKILASDQVPVEVRWAFKRRIVDRYWDAYNPPASDCRFAYVYQVPHQGCLFGWLYSEATDDLGRSTPYFVCYYLSGPLSAVQVENILTCLQKGPAQLPDRHHLPAPLEELQMPDLWSYQSERGGVEIPLSVREDSYRTVEQGRALDLWVATDPSEHPYGGYSLPHSASALEPMQTSAQNASKPRTNGWPLAGALVTILLVAGAAYGVQQWQAGQLAEIRVLADNQRYAECTVRAQAISESGQAEVQQLLRRCKAATARQTWQTVRARTLGSHADAVWSLAVSPDGRTLVSGDDEGLIGLRDLVTGELRHTLAGHATPVRSLAISSDGKTLASGDSEGIIRLWDLKTAKPRRTLGNQSNVVVWALALTPDGRMLISGDSKGVIKVRNPGTGVLLRTLKGHTDWIFAVAVSPDGKTLFSGSKDRTIRVWDLGTGALNRTLQGHKDAVRSLAVAPDGRTLASASWDKTIKLWEPATGKLRQTLDGHSQRAVALAMSPDGQTLTSGSIDHSLKIWNVRTGTLLRTLEGHSDWILSVVTSPDGRTLISTGKDKILKAWLQY